MSAQRAQCWPRAHAWTAGCGRNEGLGGEANVKDGLGILTRDPDHEEELGSTDRAEVAWGE